MSAVEAAINDTVLCLGTSPAMLFEGLRLTGAGAQVTFLDRSDTIGGGWRTRNLFGFSGVEVGAHLFENRRATTTMLRSVLGVHELTEGDAGFGLIGSRRVPLRTARAILYAGLAAKAGARRDRAAFDHAQRNLAACFGDFRVPFLYPTGGIAALIARLEALLLAANARFGMGTNVDRITIDADGVSAHAGRAQYRARNLVMSSRAHAPISGMQQDWAELRQSTLDSLVLHIDERTFAFDGYVEIFANPVIKRVRRLSVSTASGSRPLAVFQVRAMGENVAGSARDVLREASRIGLLRGVPDIEALHHESVSYSTLPPALARTICGRGQGRVATLATVDFSDPRPS